MKVETIYCDLCGYRFSGREHWEAVPASVRFLLGSPPRQGWESAAYDHVCPTCVGAIKLAFFEAVDDRRALKSSKEASE